MTSRWQFAHRSVSPGGPRRSQDRPLRAWFGVEKANAPIGEKFCNNKNFATKAASLKKLFLGRAGLRREITLSFLSRLPG